MKNIAITLSLWLLFTLAQAQMPTLKDYLKSPDPIGGTTPNTGKFTTINGNTITTGTGTITLGSVTLNAGPGGTLGTAAFTGAGAYEVPLTFSGAAVRTTNTVTIGVDGSSIEVNSSALRVKAGGVTNAMLAGSIDLTAKVTGTLPIGNGGIGITSGTSGGVLYFSGTTTIASSAALAANALVIGGGAGVAPSTTTTGAGVLTALGNAVNVTGGFATTSYVDAAVLGQNYKEATKYATTAALATVTYANGSSGVGATLTGFSVGALSVDGASPSVADRILVKNQASTFQNGIYTVTATGSGIAVFVLTRATDANQAVEWKTGDSNFVTAGTAYTNTTWAYTGADSPVIGTDAITFAQVAGQGSFTGGTGITITGTSIAIDTSVTVDKTTAQSLTNKKLGSLTTNGLVTTSGSDGTLSVTVPGTGVLAALGVNVGSAGAPVLFNGAAGTPSGIVLTNGSGLPPAGVTGTAAILGANIFTGIQTTPAARVTPANALGALAIDVTKALNTKTISVDSTFTFSGTPGSTDQWFAILVTNSDSASHVLTIPSSFSVNRNATVTTLTIPASGKVLLSWHYDGSVYNLYGDPVGTTGSGNYVLATSPIVTFAAASLSDDTYTGEVLTGYNAGASLTQWDVVYLDSSSTWQKADNDASGKYPAVGIVVATTSSSNPATVLIRGCFRDDGGSSWTGGSPVYLSATAGAMTATPPTSAGTNVQALGTALSAHVVYFAPSPDYFGN